MDAPIAAELRARGADPSSIRSRQLTAEILRDADLILTAETTHRNFILDEWQAAFRRIFALQASCRRLRLTELPPIPLVLRTRLAHATLKSVSDDCGADILNIKGAAVDALLRPVREDAAADATA